MTQFDYCSPRVFVMRLTSKGVMQLLLCLMLHCIHQKGPVPLADISGRQGISFLTLSSFFHVYVKNELVASVRGPGGGYLLGREAGQIFVCSSHFSG